MPNTRSSARLSAQGSSPSKSKENTTSQSTQAGTKRKATHQTSPASKRGKKSAPKKEKNQKTLEETAVLNGQEVKDETDQDDQSNDVEMKEETTRSEAETKEAQKSEAKITGANKSSQSTVKMEEKEVLQSEDVSEKEKPGHKNRDKDLKASGATSQKGASKSDERKEPLPSNLVEKGIIYFLTRGRVGVDDPQSVGDLQRSFIVLRPFPKDAKISSSTIRDTSNLRYIAIPKKTLPQNPRDRFMAFIEKANTSMKDLKDGYFEGKDYETKTLGTRHTPAIQPVGEGVYAITEVGGSTHLIYMLTIPSAIGEIQKDLGLREKGSLIISLKNPTRKGPSYANIGKKPDFPKEFIDEFRGLAWVGISKPEYLNYENAQLLLIGEKQNQLGKAGELAEQDEKKPNEETPAEELEKLEHEDELRVQHLDGDDTIFTDLRLDHEEYSKVPTTW